MERGKMKKIFIFITVVIVLLVVLSLAKDIIAKTAISAAVRAVTGLTLRIEDMDVGIFRTLIGIRHMQLLNPPGFTDKLMIDMPEIYVDYDLGALIRRRVHIEELRVNLREFVVVRNQEGELNLDSLKVAKKRKTEDVGKEKVGMLPMQIDRLELKIGKVIYKDYFRRTPPLVQEFNVSIDERYENITDPQALARLIVFKALTNTAIARLANFDLGPLAEGLSSTLNKATKVVEQISGKTLEGGLEAITQLEGKTKEMTEKAGEAIQKLFPMQKEEE